MNEQSACISFYECTALQKLSVLDFNATFPFPQVFGLRRLRGNPPCSLWLQSVHWTNCFTRRAHITVPPCNGTHGDRVAGDNTRSRHNLRHFPYYATSPVWQLRNRTPRILVLHTQGLPHVKNKRTCM